MNFAAPVTMAYRLSGIRVGMEQTGGDEERVAVLLDIIATSYRMIVNYIEDVCRAVETIGRWECARYQRVRRCAIVRFTRSGRSETSRRVLLVFCRPALAELLQEEVALFERFLRIVASESADTELTPMPQDDVNRTHSTVLMESLKSAYTGTTQRGRRCLRRDNTTPVVNRALQNLADDVIDRGLRNSKNNKNNKNNKIRPENVATRSENLQSHEIPRKINAVIIQEEHFPELCRLRIAGVVRFGTKETAGAL